MTPRVPLTKSPYLTIVSAYAPTMCDTNEANEGFYDKLNVAMNSIPHNNKIVH